MGTIIKQRIVSWNILLRNALPDADIFIRKEIALGRNHLALGSQVDQVSPQQWHIGDIEPQGAGPLVILGMSRAKDTEK